MISRQVGESIVAGNNVRVAVLGKRVGRVRIGISASRAVALWREEIYEGAREDDHTRATSSRCSAPTAVG